MVAYAKFDESYKDGDFPIEKADIFVGGVGDPQYTFKMEARKETVHELVFILNAIHNSGLTATQLEHALRGAALLVNTDKPDERPLLQAP